MTTITAPAAVPVFPLSMFGPVHLGIDENGETVCVNLGERNMLLGGEPGGGKSNAVNLITAHGALSGDCKLILIDGKQVELGPWRHCADNFVGPSMTAALDCARNLQQIMNNRYDKLLAAGLRKITPETGRTRLPRRHRRIRLLLRHRRHQDPASRVLRADPRPRRPRPRRRGHRHPRHPAAESSGHRPQPPRPVRLPVGLPLHHRLLLRHRPRARLGRRGLHRRQHRPPRPRRLLAPFRDRHPPADQGRLPHRRRHQAPGGLRRPAPQKGPSMSPANAIGARLGVTRQAAQQHWGAQL